jgi:hypothetical protein
LPGELPWSWYAVMSDAAVPSYESISAAARVTKPLLMVHSDQCAIPDAARRRLPLTHVQAVVSVVKPVASQNCCK